LNSQSLSDRYYRILYEALLDGRLLTTSKHGLFLSLLFRSIRADTDLKRVKGFCKRILQIAFMGPTQFTCACLYLVGKVCSIHPGVRILIEQGESDSSEEVFRDADKMEEEEKKKKGDEMEVDGEDKKSAADKDSRKDGYDGSKRDPRFSNADRSCLWELVRLFFPFSFPSFLLVHKK
jgi:ribosome biogenesis protein MAK21